MFETLGLIGTVLVAAAYFPQLRHLWFKRCSACISLNTWFIWAIATLLILIHAYSADDLVFKVFATVNLSAIILTLVLAGKYHKQTCELHQ